MKNAQRPMSKLSRKPTAAFNDAPARFAKFGLRENPFPSEPTVNKDSQDPRINGEIYEMELRQNEFERVRENFLRADLAQPNHLRLGYIIDTSYIGRGNGKSAFLVNLQDAINRHNNLDISEEKSKCFALYVVPESGGRTKTFASLLNLIFDAMLRLGIIEESLATIRLNAVTSLYTGGGPAFSPDDDVLIENLRSEQWYTDNEIDLSAVRDAVRSHPSLQDLPPDFPLFREFARGGLYAEFVTQADFEQYFNLLKNGRERFEFVLSHMVRFFRAADFTGAFILLDDFERIPDFQSRRQRKDFALELRSALFDGPTLNARLGFYNMFLVLHAGVPPLIADAWSESGMENRSPLLQQADRHVIPFEKLNPKHAKLLLKKYLGEYREEGAAPAELAPFTEAAIKEIGEVSEFNAAKILKLAYGLLEHAADEDRDEITEVAVSDYREKDPLVNEKLEATIATAESVDLLKKATGTE
jgi:hypothetical protein